MTLAGGACLLGAALVGVVQVLIWRFRVGPANPQLGDGEEFLRFSRAPRPFCWRWLVPLLCRSHERRWRWSSMISLALLPAALVLFLMGTHRGNPLSWLLVATCLTTVPAIYERSMRVLYLVDAPALLLSLLSAAAALTPWRWYFLPVVLLVGSTRETAPLFAAIWSWNPLPLLGFLTVPFYRRGGPPWRNPHLFHRPWQTYTRMRMERGFGPEFIIMWGAFLPAFPRALSASPVQVLTCLVMAALPLFRSIDTARLLVPWVVPTLAPAMCEMAPGSLLACLLLGIALSSQWIS